MLYDVYSKKKLNECEINFNILIFNIFINYEIVLRLLPSGIQFHKDGICVYSSGIEIDDSFRMSNSAHSGNNLYRFS